MPGKEGGARLLYLLFMMLLLVLCTTLRTVHPNPIPAIGFNFYVRWPFLFSGFFLSPVAGLVAVVSAWVQESLFYTLAVHIIIIPLSRCCSC